MALLLATCVFALPAFGQEEPSSDLLERIRALEEQVKELRAATPAEEPKPESTEDDDDEEWVLAPEDVPPSPTRKLSYGEDWKHPYGFVDDGKHPVVDLPKDMRLKLSGQLQIRGEYRDPSDFRIPGQAGRPASDEQSDATDFALLRTRIGLDFYLHKNLRALIELQDSRIWGDQPANQDTAEIFVLQSFLEIAEPLDLPLWIWVGRWKVPQLGDGRLLSPLFFNNVTRSWDGVQVFGHFGGTSAKPKVWATVFSANVREGAVFSSDGDENDDFWFNGLYVSLRAFKGHEIDAYVFNRYFSDRVFTSEKRSRLGDRKDYTLGFRTSSDFGFAGFTTEVVWQYGDVAGDRVRAWATAVRGWLQFDFDDERSLRVAAEYAYASGDRDPNDGKIQNFDPILPQGFRHQGNMGLVSWSNIHDVSLEAEFTILPGVVLRSEGHAFWLAKRKDGWYGLPRTPIRRDPTGNANGFLGTELDFMVEWTLFDEHLRIRAAYSHFWSGGFIRDTGRGTSGRSSGDMDYAFLEFQLNF
ncbi:MAG: alginate export family protein [Planctomycetes bacterium]|nr:alginate export family protein [Planctomycetota bacterium]